MNIPDSYCGTAVMVVLESRHCRAPRVLNCLGVVTHINNADVMFDKTVNLTPKQNLLLSEGKKRFIALLTAELEASTAIKQMKMPMC